MLRGILLDLYGTVVGEDDEVVAEIVAAVHAGATRECTVEEVGEDWWARYQRLTCAACGESFRTQREIAVTSLAGTIAAFGSSADPEGLCARQFARWRAPELLPGARDFLAALQVPVCVLSDIDRTDGLAAIAAHDLPLTTVVTSEDVRSYKPRPAGFRTALDALGIPPGEAVYIGDSLRNDIAGAAAVGVPAIWVNRRGRPVPTGIAAVPSLPAALPLLTGR